MNRKLFLFLLGRIAIINGAVLIVPLVFSLYWGEPGLVWFVPSIVVTLGLGAVFLKLGQEHRRQLTVSQGAWYMVSVWLLLGCVGMIPYVLSGIFTPVDAFFQSVSAYTTAGVTCVPLGTGPLPRSLLLWNSVMEWMGGLNFIIMLVTVLPQVSGCFGITLSAHQSINFSPMVGRMREAARQTARIYAVITMISLGLYWLAGLDVVDAFMASLMTVSTSGSNSGFDFIRFNNPWLELAGVASMLMASGNFLLYWKGLERRNMRGIFRDTEIQTFLGLVIVAGTFVSMNLWYSGVYTGFESVRYGFFQVVSFISTSGFSSAPFMDWPEFDRFALFTLVFAGGCIGSATGGMRVMRFIVLFKMAAQEMRRTLHPHMVICVKINTIPVDMKIVSRVLSYFFLFMAAFFISMLIISLSGVTTLQAMGIAAGCLSSVGSTIELFGIADFSVLPAWTKLYCGFLMILGRVEIFSFLIVIQTIGQYMRRKW
jgi:trk system potassium uptake protein TrkH